MRLAVLLALAIVGVSTAEGEAGVLQSRAASASLSAADAPGHCAQDPSHDHLISFADIGMFTSVFGQPNLDLDYAPIPLGNGVIDFGDIGGATAIFGETCLGIWSGSTATPENMAAATVPVDYPEISGCAYNLAFPGYVISGGYAHLTKWAGGAGCWHGSGVYNIACSIQVRQLYGQEWQVSAALGSIDADGTICTGQNDGVVHSLECGKLTAGFYYHDIWWAPSGGTLGRWHSEGHWMLADFSQVFVPC